MAINITTERASAGQTVFNLPIHNKTATAKVNGGAVTIASQTDSSVTLAVATAYNDLVEITFNSISGAGTGSSTSTSGFNPVATAYPLRKFSAAMGKMRAGVRNVKVLLLGDSTTAGSGAGGVGFTAGGMPLTTPIQLGKELNRLGLPASAHGLFGEGARGGALADNATGNLTTFASFDPRWVVGGADWIRNALGNGLGGPMFSNNSGVNPLTFTPTAAGAANANVDTFIVYYATTPTGGTFSWAIDGGATTNQATVTGSNGVAALTIPAGSLGAHSLALRRVSGGVYILGVRAYDSTVKQIEVLVGARSSGYAADFVFTTQPWSAGSFIPYVAPDLTVIHLQINDTAFATPLATYVANIQALIDIAKTTGDVVLRTGYPSSIAYNANTTLANQTLYRDALVSLAAANAIPLDDVFGRLGSYEIQQAVPGGAMYSDGLHPASPVYSGAAASLADIIRQY